LAGAAKGLVKIAYWDTEQGGRPPRLLGEIKGTPTIRLFKPKKKQKDPKAHSDKAVLDYNGERKAPDMKTFIEYSMPNYAERISFPTDLAKSFQKASKFGLPTAMLFPRKPKTSSITKFLSTIFRRRLLLVEVVPNVKNEEVMKQYDITPDQLPVLIVKKEGDDTIVRYDGTDFSRRKLERFLSDHAKKEPVYKPIVSSDDQENGEEVPEQKVHEEF